MKNVFLALKSWMFLPVFTALLIFSCRRNRQDSPIIEKEITLTGFTKIYGGDRFNLIITKGDNFYIKVKGPSNDLNDVNVSVANNILDIQYSGFQNNRSRVDVHITLPSLVSINLTGAATATVEGFQDNQHVTRAILSGNSRLVMDGTGTNLQVDITGSSRLDVAGTTSSLYGTLSGGAKLNAYELSSAEVDISALDRSEAYVKVNNTLFANASGGSRIYYKGCPVTKNMETSTGGLVVGSLESGVGNQTL